MLRPAFKPLCAPVACCPQAPQLGALAERAALLATNEQVASLHSALVKTSIISEEDFWASQAHLLAAATAKRGLGQRIGIASSFMAEPEKDGRTRKACAAQPLPSRPSRVRRCRHAGAAAASQPPAAPAGRITAANARLRLWPPRRPWHALCRPTST